MKSKLKCLTVFLLALFGASFVALADYPNIMTITIHNTGTGYINNGGCTWAYNGNLIGQYSLTPGSQVVLYVDPHSAPSNPPNDIWAGYNENGTWIYKVTPFNRENGPWALDVYFGPAPCTTNLVTTETNNAAGYIYHYWYAFDGGGYEGTVLDLAYGQHGDVSKSVNCDIAYAYHVHTSWTAVDCQTNLSRSVTNSDPALDGYYYWTNGSTRSTSGDLLHLSPLASGTVSSSAQIQCSNLPNWFVGSYFTNLNCLTNVTITAHNLNATLPGWVDFYYPRAGSIVGGGYIAPGGQMSCSHEINICDPSVNFGYSMTNFDDCKTNLTFHYTNSSAAWIMVGVSKQGVPSSVTSLSLLGPGANYEVSKLVPCSEAGQWNISSSAGSAGGTPMDTGIKADGGFPQSSGGDGPGKSGGNGNGTPLVNGAGGSSGNGSGMNSDNAVTNIMPTLTSGAFTNPILPIVTNDVTKLLWSNTNQDVGAVTPAVKDMADALWKAQNQMAAQSHSDFQASSSQAHADAQAVANNASTNAVAGAAQAHTDAANSQGLAAAAAALAHTDAQANNMTNYALETTQQQIKSGVDSMDSSLYTLKGTGTGMSNVLGSAANTIVGISNMMAGATNSQYIIAQSMTNATAAMAAGTAALGDYGVDAVIAGITPSLPPETTGVPDMTMSFCGETIDLDPNRQFPMVSAFSLAGFKIVLYLAFAFTVATLFWQTVRTMAASSTGGVPDFEATFLGVGGNFVGAFLFGLVALAFIGLYVFVLTWLFSHFSGYMANCLDINGWAGQMGSIGYYLLTSFFPVNLAFSLAFTRLTLTFTMAKLLGIAAAAMRFLPGK